MRKKISILLLIIISLNMFISFAFAEINETPVDPSQVDTYYFDINMFNNMVSSFVDNGGSDYFLSQEYTSLNSNIPHTPLLRDPSIIQKVANWVTQNNKPNIQMFDDRFNSMSGAMQLITPYVKEGLIYWRPYEDPSEVVTSGSATLKSYITYTNIYVASLYKSVGSDLKGKDIGIDSYGNIITSDDRHVIVPFFMNRYFFEKALPNIQKYKVVDNVKITNKASLIPFLPSNSSANYNDIINSLKSLNAKTSYVFFINKSGEIQFLKGSDKNDPYIVTTDDIVNSIPMIQSSIDESKTKEFILAVFANVIKDYNKNFIDTGIANKGNTDKIQAYLGQSDYGTGQDTKTDLTSLVTELLNNGVWGLTKLTLASAITEAYQEIFINFSAKYLFYTSHYGDSGIYANVIGAFLALLAGILIIYILLSSINILRGRLTFKQLIIRVLFILVIITTPVFLYPRLVNIVFNKIDLAPLDGTVQQMALLDRWTMLAQDSFSSSGNTTPFNQVMTFRGIYNNYMVKFYTNEFTVPNLQDKVYQSYNDEQKNEYLHNQINANRVSVNVDVNNLINYLQSDSNENLFQYLANNDSVDYSGLSAYTEYSMYIHKNDREAYTATNILDTTKVGDGKGLVSSTDIGKALYKYYGGTNIDLQGRLRALADLISSSYISAQEKNRIVSILEDIPLDVAKTYYSQESKANFKNDSDYQIFLREKDLMQQCNYGDIAGIYNFLLKNTVVNTPSDPNIRIIRDIVNNVNREIINYYINNLYMTEQIMSQNYIGDQSFLQSETDFIKLNIYFDLSKYMFNQYFPTSIDKSGIESDVYLRALLIPVKEMTPDNIEINNASKYVGYKSILTLGTFVIFILVLIAYGLVKYLVISVILLPLMVALFIWNYIVKEDIGSKVWFGALWILGMFALIQAGFALLLRYVIYRMDMSLSDMVVGRSSFFNTFTNIIIVIIYFAVVYMYLLVPTFKAVKANISDLGGAKLYASTENLINRVGNSVKNTSLGKRISKSDNTNNIDKKDTKDTTKDKELYEEKMALDNEKEVEKVVERKDIDEKIRSKKKRGLEGGGNTDIAGEEVSNVDDYIKELRDLGIITASVKEVDNLGEASLLEFKNEIVTGKAKEYFNKKGLKTELNGNKLKINAEKDEAKSYLNNFKDNIESNEKELNNVRTDDIQSASYIKYDSDGIEVDNNDITSNIVEQLKETEGIDYSVNDDKIKIFTDKPEETANKVAKLSGMMAKVRGKATVGIAKVPANIPVVEEAVKNNSIIEENRDYIKQGDNYVSLNGTGYKELVNILNKLNKENEILKEGLKDVNISEINGFNDDVINSARKHIIENTSYNTTEIMDIVQNLKKTNENLYKDLQNKIYRMSVIENNKLVAYTDNNVDSKELEKLMIKIQQEIGKKGD